jgi:hypothetical protein
MTKECMRNRELQLTPEEKNILDERLKPKSYQKIVSYILYAFHALDNLQILTLEYRKKIIETAIEEDPELNSIYEGLVILSKNNCLSKENVTSFMQYHRTWVYRHAANFVLLDQYKISTEQNRHLVSKTSDPHGYVAKTLNFLTKNNLLNKEIYSYLQDNYEVITDYPALNDAKNDFISVLSLETSLTPPLILTTLRRLRVDMMFQILKLNKLNTEENKLKLKENILHGKELYRFIWYLSGCNILTQINFDALILHASFLDQHLKISYHHYPWYVNFRDEHGALNDTSFFEKILKKNITNSALECAQMQHAARQKLHFFHRIPDDVLKHIYTFVAPLKAEQKKHFMKNIFKLPNTWHALPSHPKTHKRAR